MILGTSLSTKFTFPYLVKSHFRMLKTASFLKGKGFQTQVLKVIHRKAYYCQFASHRQWLEGYPGGSVDIEKNEKTGIAVVKLNHTDRKNALSGKMMVQLADITDELNNWSAGKGFVLYGAGETFCSGGDLTLMKDISVSEKGRRMCEFMQDTLWRMFNLPLVSVALLKGKVLGGGAEVAAACDFRLVTDTVSIGFVQSKMGISPGWGGGTRLVQILGRTHALELLVSGKILNADETISVGFANGKVTKTSDISELELAKQWLQKHVKGDPQVTQALKKLVVGGINGSAAESMENEKELFASVWGGSAHLRAMSQNIKHN